MLIKFFTCLCMRKCLVFSDERWEKTRKDKEKRKEKVKKYLKKNKGTKRFEGRKKQRA